MAGLKEQVIERVETVLERTLTKKNRKDFLATVGPFLLIVTFIEDGLRIFLRWGEQIHYMTQVMKMNWYLGVFCLLLSAATQLGASALVIRPAALKPTRVKP